MRRTSRALVALLIVFIVPCVWADDPPIPYEPPEARIKPPGGVTAQSRIKPPGGEPTTDARIKPPSGTPESGIYALLLQWLRALQPPAR